MKKLQEEQIYSLVTISIHEASDIGLNGAFHRIHDMYVHFLRRLFSFLAFNVVRISSGTDLAPAAPKDTLPRVTA